MVNKLLTACRRLDRCVLHGLAWVCNAVMVAVPEHENGISHVSPNIEGVLPWLLVALMAGQAGEFLPAGGLVRLGAQSDPWVI
jgi:hypothetical protein